MWESCKVLCYKNWGIWLHKMVTNSEYVKAKIKEKANKLLELKESKDQEEKIKINKILNEWTIKFEFKKNVLIWKTTQLFIYVLNWKYYKLEKIENKEILEKAHTETYYQTHYMGWRVKQNRFVEAVYWNNNSSIDYKISDITRDDYLENINLDKILSNISSEMRRAINAQLRAYNENLSINLKSSWSGINPAQCAGLCWVTINGKDFTENWSWYEEYKILSDKYEEIITKLELKFYNKKI